MFHKLAFVTTAILLNTVPAIAQTAQRDTSFHRPDFDCSLYTTGRPATTHPCLVRILDSVTTVTFGEVAFEWSESPSGVPTFSAIKLGQAPIVLERANIEYATRAACASGAFGDGKIIAVCYDRSVPVSGTIND